MTSLSPIVSGFNSFASVVRSAGQYVPSWAAGGVKFLAKELPTTDGFKTLVIKPLALFRPVLERFNRQSDYPNLLRLSVLAGNIKVMMNGLDCVSKLPKMLESFSRDVSREQETRLYRHVVSAAPGKEVRAKNEYGPDLTKTEVVFSRFFHVAAWCIAVGDAINLVRNYRTVPKILDKATPWIYAVAGGYMGAQALYAEWRYAQGTWRDETKKAVPAEKYYGCLKLATNVAYLFSSIVCALGTRFKANESAWFDKCQFAATVGIILLPVAEKCAERWMQVSVWNTAV